MVRVTRETLANGDIRRMIEEAGVDLRPLSDAELAASLEATLAAAPPDAGPVWVFAYGSLIWNPALHVAERVVGTVHGWHRWYCLRTPLGRGTPDHPGLMLGLDRGGRCRGVALRIDDAIARDELALLWRREMVVGSYTPRWVRVRTDTGGTIPAITFTINRAHRNYAGRPAPDEVAHVLATAGGAMGTCAEYYVNTLAGLRLAGIRDRRLFALEPLFEAHILALPDTPRHAALPAPAAPEPG